MKKKILIGLVAVLIGIQLIRPEKNNGNAEAATDVSHFVQVPDNVGKVLKASCYDCHSNHTNYPWYSEIMPFGWLLNHHVTDGKKHLNFSDFSTYSLKKIDHKLEETAEEVEEHEMPIGGYTLIHKEAELSEEQVKLIVNWVKEERSKLNVVTE